MSSRLPIIFILATVTLDAMGIGLIMPVMPDLLREVMGEDLGSAAIWSGILATSFAAMQFLFSPLIGNLSDRFGRKPILLISLIVMAFDYVLMALAGALWLLLIGRIIGGITSATHATALAYMADISEPKDKAANFGLIGAGFGIGFVFGPAIGGGLAEFGTRAPFWAAAVLAITNAGLGWLVLKETVTDKTRRRFEWRRANPFAALASLSKLPGIGPLLLVYFFYYVASFVYPTIWSFFTVERFDWSPGTIGLSLAIFGVAFAAVQGLLVKPSIARWGQRPTVIIGLALEALAMLLPALIWSGTLLLWLIPFSALGAIGLPALQGILSQRVSDDAQGELQGVLTSVTSLAAIISPLIMTRSFAYFTSQDAPAYLPGAPFLIATALMLISLMLFHLSKRPATT